MNSRYVYRLIIFLLTALWLPLMTQAVDAQSSLADLGAPQPDPQREWTVMVYLDADNDLEAFALADLNEMEAGMPAAGVEVVVLIDRAEGFAGNFDDWQDSRVYRVRPDADPKRIASEILAKPGELNMGAPETLTAFISGAVRRFPARHYALILWDHGGGWLHLIVDHKAPDTPQGHDDLNVAEVGAALRQALQATGLQRLDLVGFDMCLMAQLEMAYELAGVAEVMVASQAVEPGNGWPYEQILPAFAKGTLGARRLGAQIVEAYGRHYEARRERVATQSAIDLTAIDEAVRSFDSLATQVLARVPQGWSKIARSFFYAESYADRTEIRAGSGALGSVDLLDMVKRLRFTVPNFPAEESYRQLVQAMDRLIIANYTSPRHRLSHGLAIYAPVTGEQFNQAYANTRLARDTTWPRLLGQLYAAEEQHLSTPKIVDLKVVDHTSKQPITRGKVGGGFELQATIEGDNVLWVQALHASRDTQNKGLLILDKGYILDPRYYDQKKVETAADVVDLLMPQFAGSRNTVSQEYVGHRIYVTDNQQAALATVDGSSLTDLEHVAVPVLIKRANVGEHQARVFFNVVTWDAVNVVAKIPQPDGSIAYRQIEPQADDEITLLFEFHPDDGGKAKYLRGETLRWRKGLELLIGNDKPGEVIMAVQAESIGGRSGFATTSLTIEPFTPQEQTFLDNASKVERRHLPGKWRWYGLKDGQWQPLPVYTEILPSSKNPDVLVARTEKPDDPTWRVIPQMVLLDQRLTPALRFISFDEQNRPVEAQNYTLLVSRWEQDTPRMILKWMVPAGWLLLWVKETPTPAPSAALPPSPPPPPATVAPPSPPALPAPAPPASLVGLWQSDSGFVLAMNDTQYELYEGGELVDTGRYQLQGTRLVVFSLDGSREVYQFQSDGQTLALRGSEGDSYFFRRVR